MTQECGVGWSPAGHEHAGEVRAFLASLGVEDPVTGSLNASPGQWLIRTGELPAAYIASQGTRLGRRGVVRVGSSGGQLYGGGACTVCLRGTVLLQEPGGPPGTAPWCGQHPRGGGAPVADA